jgi:hypothetical protein
MAVVNVTVHFEDGTSRDFGDAAWSWRDGLLTIMHRVGPFQRSVPTSQIPYDAIKILDIEYDDDTEMNHGE